MAFLTKQKIYNFAVYGFGQAVNLLSPLLVMPYIVSVCGEAGLGKAGVGLSFAFMTLVLVDAGSYINGTKDIALHQDNHELLEEKFNTIYLSKLLLLLGVLCCSLLILVALPFFRADFVQLALSLLIVVGQAINPTWFFQGTQDFKAISVLNVASKALYVAAVFLLIKSSGDYIWVNAFLGIGMIVSGLAGYAVICRRHGIDPKKSNLRKAKSLIRQEASLSVSQLFFSAYQYAPIMIVSYICGSYVAGQYRIIDQIVMIFRTYLQMFFNFVYAEVCVKIFENVQHGLTEWRKYNVYNGFLVVVLLAAFYIAAVPLLEFFKVGLLLLDPMARTLRLGLWIPLLMAVSFALKQLVFAFNRNRPYIRITIGSAILMVLLMIPMLQWLNIMGAFITLIALELAVVLVYIVVLQDKLFTSKN